MERNASLVTLVALLFSTMLFALASNLVYAQTSTIVIGVDGSVTPASALISTSDGVTFVLTGDVFDQSIIVSKNNITLDGAGHTLTGTNVVQGKAVDLTGCLGVTVRNLQVRSFYYGIFLSDSVQNNISGNMLANNPYGIFLQSSSDGNMLTGNNVTFNTYGIWLTNSDGNILSSNNVEKNLLVGVYLDLSSGNTVTQNGLANNGNGVWLVQASDTIYLNNFLNNSVDAHSESSVSSWSSPDKFAYTFGGKGYENYLGNYWSFQNGSDADQDGLIDLAHSVSDFEADGYSLAQPIQSYVYSALPAASPTQSPGLTPTASPPAQSSSPAPLTPAPTNLPVSAQSLSEVRTPPPNYFVLAAVGTAVTAVILSIGLWFTSGNRPKIELPDLLKGFLKSYGAKLFEQVDKLEVEKLKREPLLSRNELVEIVVSVSLMTVVFGFVEANGYPRFFDAAVFVSVVPKVLVSVVTVKLAAVGFEMAVSKVSRVYKRFSLWVSGIAAFLLSGFVFMFPFSSPGITRYKSGVKSVVGKCLVVLSKNLLLLTLCIPFAVLTMWGYTVIGDAGLFATLTTVCYSLVPLQPLSGKAVYDFNKGLSFVLPGLMLVLIYGFSLQMFAMTVFIGVGVASGLLAAAALFWLRKND